MRQGCVPAERLRVKLLHCWRRMVREDGARLVAGVHLRRRRRRWAWRRRRLRLLQWWPRLRRLNLRQGLRVRVALRGLKLGRWRMHRLLQHGRLGRRAAGLRGACGQVEKAT